MKPLPPNTQDRVRQILLDLKQQQQGRKNMNKREKRKVGLNKDDGLESCVDDVAEKLITRLPRMPFPPTTDELQFDFEGTIQRVQSLEAQLSSNIESMNLLRTQIAKEERLLARDKQEVEQLNQALKASEALKKRQDKTLHPITKKMETNVVREDDSIPSQHNESSVLSSLESDSEINPLLDQLRSHLESIWNNTAPMRPVAEAVDQAQDALDNFTYRALNRSQYTALFGLEDS